MEARWSAETRVCALTVTWSILIWRQCVLLGSNTNLCWDVFHIFLLLLLSAIRFYFVGEKTNVVMTRRFFQVHLRCFYILNEKAVSCQRRVFCPQDAVVLCSWETPSPAEWQLRLRGRTHVHEQIKHKSPVAGHVAPTLFVIWAHLSAGGRVNKDEFRLCIRVFAWLQSEMMTKSFLFFPGCGIGFIAETF